MMLDNPSDDGMFESINLESSKGLVRSSMSVKSNSDAHHVHTASDEDELDPTDFLSPELPEDHPGFQKSIVTNPGALDEGNGDNDEIKGAKIGVGPSKASSKTSDQLSSILGEDAAKKEPSGLQMMRSTYSLLFGSSILPEPNLPFLSEVMEEWISKRTSVRALEENNTYLIHEVLQCVNLHSLILKNGDRRLNLVRSAIRDYLQLLSENSLALNELYSSELALTQRVVSNLSKWDAKRNKVLNKILKIKSSQNKTGNKLKMLVEECNDVDEQISNLELRLQELRLKKQAIASEITNTSSVLESKTSKYVNYFRHLEKQGELAISKYLTDFSFGSPEKNTSIKIVPVDVTFRKNMEDDLSLGQDHKSNDHHIEFTERSKGLELTSKAVAISTDKSLSLDKNLGSDASNIFELGRLQGTEQSRKLKEHLGHLFKSISKVQPRSNIARPLIAPYTILDDSTNTITQKIDLNPILEFVHNEAIRLQEFINISSYDATLFHLAGSCWNEILDLLELQENTMQKQLEMGSGTSTEKIEINHTLTSLIEKIGSKIKEIQANDIGPSFTKGLWPSYFFMKAVRNELDSILDALKLVSNGSFGKSTPFLESLGISDERLSQMLSELNKETSTSSPLLRDTSGMTTEQADHLLHASAKSSPLTGVYSSSHLSSNLKGFKSPNWGLIDKTRFPVSSTFNDQLAYREKLLKLD